MDHPAKGRAAPHLAGQTAAQTVLALPEFTWDIPTPA